MKLIQNIDFYNGSIFAAFALIPIFPLGSSFALIILFVIFLYKLVYTKELVFTKNNLLIAVLSLYLFYVLGLLWSNNIPLGLKTLEYKFSFLLLPIIFSFKYEKFTLWKNITGLLYGNIMASIFLIFNILSNYFSNDNLFSSEISPVIHPTYLSIYLTTGISILFYNYRAKKIKWPKYLTILLMLTWSILLIFLLSFAAVLFFMSFVFFILMIKAYKKVKTRGVVIIGATLLLGFYLLLSKSSFLSYDYETTLETVQQISGESIAKTLKRYRDATSGTKERVVLWIVSAEIIKENFWGSGTGNINEYLNQKYDWYNLFVLKKAQMNPHNQFFQIGVELGVIGIILLISVFSYTIYLSLKTRNFILLVFILNLSFNCLFESILERQFGIIFSTLMICMFIVYYPYDQKTFLKSNS